MQDIAKSAAALAICLLGGYCLYRLFSPTCPACGKRQMTRIENNYVCKACGIVYEEEHETWA